MPDQKTDDDQGRRNPNMGVLKDARPQRVVTGGKFRGVNGDYDNDDYKKSLGISGKVVKRG